MRKLTSAASLALVVFAIGCSDKSRDGGIPTGARSNSLSSTVTLGSCTTLSNLYTLANQVFGSGSPNVQSVIGKLNNMDKFVQQGDAVDAQAQAKNIVSFVQQKAAQGTLPGTPAQINTFLAGVLCYAGLSPDTFLIQPTDQPQILKSNSGSSGISLQGNTVSVPTLLTINTLDPNGPSPLITKLDQYPTYIDITVSSPLTKTAVVAICLNAPVPADVFARLRLGHQASTGFEIPPPADPSFLGCSTSLASANSSSHTPKWLRSLASLFIPKAAYARQMLFATGGVGGSVTELSPFDAVDGTLFATGGVGGSVIELQRTPVGPAAPGKIGPQPGPSRTILPGSRSSTVMNGVCTSVDGTVGTSLDPLCRPAITLATAKGTIMQNVPVTWAVTSGGGTIAPDTTADQACGAYGSTAATATDVNGKASICWTLGLNGGSNTVTATPSAGGDAPAGVKFSPAITGFTASGIKITPVATATGATATFDGLAHAGSGTCDNNLTPALTYNTGDGNAPVNAGTWTLTVTCGANSNTFNTVTATASVTINPVAPAVAVSCPVSAVFNNTAQTPCTASVTAIGGLSLTPTPTYSNNTNVGTATASYTFAATGNYAAASGSATFTITPAATTTTVTCSPSSVVYNGGAQTPCSANVAGPGLNQNFAPSYTANVNAGTATASYTFAAGGNYLGSSGSKNFTITQATPSVAVACSTGIYTGAPVTPCTASVSGPGLSLTATPSYTNNVNAGVAMASYTYAGGGNFTGATGSASFTILSAVTAASVSCPASVTYTGLPQTPCTGAVVGPLLSQAVTPTYSNNVVGTATAMVNYLGGGNYQPSSASTTFKILYVQSGCFAAPIYSVQPPTKSYQKAGSNLPVKCTLLTASGTAVTNATGNLLIQDRGLLGTDPPVTVFNQANVFKMDQNKNYNYGLDTGLPGFVSLHYYFVTASWSDGSTTTGWFYLK